MHFWPVWIWGDEIFGGSGVEPHIGRGCILRYWMICTILRVSWANAPDRYENKGTTMLRFHAAAALALSLAATTTTTLAAEHPLDPLSAQEIRRARMVISQTVNLKAIDFFPSIDLIEPSKESVAAYAGEPFTRRALVYGYDFHARTLYHIVVNLTTRQVEDIDTFAGEQPPVGAGEFLEADAITRASSAWQAEMARRGIDVAQTYLDVWAGGEMAPGDDGANGHAGHRILRVLSFLRGGTKAPNPYVRPIEGVVAAVCMDHKVLAALELSDNVRGGAAYPVNPESGDPESVRAQLPALTTTGQGFTLDGNLLTWDNWRLRVGFSFREGLVLHKVEYKDAMAPGGYRPILYRGSLSEIYVPYARDHLNWSWRTAFDVGEYHLGQYANSLELDVDVPGNAALLDATVSDDTLTPYSLPGAIGIYEQHSGLLWARVDPTSYVKSARGHRKLHLTWHAWIGNYIYGFTWILGRDGSIEMKVALTGTPLFQGVQVGDGHREADESGALVAPGVGAPSHQHFFNFRLDLDVDGIENTATEIDTAHDPFGPFGNGFDQIESELATETFRDHSVAANRTWAVQHTTKKNRIDHPTGYALLPGDFTPVYSSPTFPAAGRAAFAKHPFWVTRFDPAQFFAAGDHPFAGLPNKGLPEFIANGENTSAQDIVMWHSIGFTHHPHPEEYPVMNAEHIGFKLLPDGFFNRNPALDVPVKR